MSKEIKLNIREAKIKDVEKIAELTQELGYEITITEVRKKLQKFDSNSFEKIYIAEYENVTGWMHISKIEPLESPSFAEIRGIVVKKEFRNKGIGTKLIKTAEKWARKSGCTKIRVRTNINRVETRKYYKNLKFISKKTQEVFEKEI